MDSHDSWNAFFGHSWVQRPSRQSANFVASGHAFGLKCSCQTSVYVQFIANPMCGIFISVLFTTQQKKKNIESITARTIMGPIGTNCTSNRYSAVSDGSNWTSRDILAVEQQERDYVPKCFDRTFFRALFIMWGFSVRTCLSISICHKERAVQGA